MDKKGIIKHKKIFDAWLDGKTIQYYVNSNNTWQDIVNPDFYQNSEYRIKPEFPNFKFGETILVSDDQIDWKERIFINSDNDKVYTFSKYSFNILINMSEKDIIRKFDWKYAKRIEYKPTNTNKSKTSFNPKPGDHIFVRDDIAKSWLRRIFVRFDIDTNKYVCIGGLADDIINLTPDDKVRFIYWDCAKPICDNENQSWFNY